jgi:hypothetical protein
MRRPDNMLTLAYTRRIPRFDNGTGSGMWHLKLQHESDEYG